MTKNKKIKNGKLEVICGPMFGGKTLELIRRIKRVTLAKRSIQVYKPLIDKRYGEHQIKTHDKDDLERITGVKPYIIKVDLSDFDSKTNVDVVAFDEVQFFGNEIMKVIRTLVYSGKRVICAGLDLDYNGYSFGWMPEILSLADRVTKLKGVCMVCGKPSTRTYRKTSIKSDSTILVGGIESYETRCKRCWGLGRQQSKME